MTDERDGVWIDQDGLMHRGRAWVALSDLEWRLVRVLFDRLGHLVSRADLRHAGWPGRAVAEERLTHRIARLRRRLEPLGVRITAVRGRGYVLIVDP